MGNNDVSIIFRDNTEEGLEKAIKRATYVLECLDNIDETVSISAFNEDGYLVILGRAEYIEDDHEGALLVWSPNQETINSTIAPAMIDEYIETLNKRKKELLKEIRELENMHPYNGLRAFLHSEDCDDDYQEALEVSWELNDLREELASIEAEIEELKH